jgi:hypothetical protein
MRRPDGMWHACETVTARLADTLDRARPAVDGRPRLHPYHQLCRATDWVYRLSAAAHRRAELRRREQRSGTPRSDKVVP